MIYGDVEPVAHNSKQMHVVCRNIHGSQATGKNSVIRHHVKLSNRAGSCCDEE